MALIDCVKFDCSVDDVLVWKYPSEKLTLGTQLIVNQSQEAVFVKGGKALDIFGPGTHTLSTGNLPFLQKLINLPFGGKTPFTAEVWFVNKTIKRGLKWGTQGPVQVMDPIYMYPVNLRAFGEWGLRVTNSQAFINQMVGTQLLADSAKIEEYFRGEIIQRLTDQLAKFVVEQNVSVFQLAAKTNDLSSFVQNAISPEFSRFGIEIVNFNVARTSIADEDMQQFQKIQAQRMQLSVINQSGQAYATMRSFDTLEAAAQNPNGNMGQMLGAGLGMGVGLSSGMAVGQQVGNAMNPNPSQNPAPQPSADDPMAKLQKLKQLLEMGLISSSDFETKKQEILSSL